MRRLQYEIRDKAAIAMNQVTICPPGPQDPALFFDQPRYLAFRAVVPGNGLDFRSLESMHSVSGPDSQSACEVPEWAWNDLKFRAVIMEADRRHQWAINKIKSCARNRQSLEILKQVGSYRALVAAIAYRCWRLGYPPLVVADELGITRLRVRRLLFRLWEAAEAIENPKPRARGGFAHPLFQRHLNLHVHRGIRNLKCKYCQKKAA
jgi:hypothetical protein